MDKVVTLELEIGLARRILDQLEAQEQRARDNAACATEYDNIYKAEYAAIAEAVGRDKTAYEMAYIRAVDA